MTMTGRESTGQSLVKTFQSNRLTLNQPRRLLLQLGENVVSNSWDGPTSVGLMRDLMMTTSRMVDNQSGINNYSDFILNQPKLTNHSSEWESSLSLDNPEIQTMIDKLPSRGPPREDRDWDRCMKKDLSNLENDQLPAADFDLCDDLPDVSSFDQSPPSRKFQFKQVKNVKDSESSFLNLPLDPRPTASKRPEPPVLQKSNSIPPRLVRTLE